MSAVEVNAPGFLDLVAEDAELECIGSGFTFTEGPVWTNRDGGSLLFSELSVATVKVVYKSVRGLDSFLGSVTSRNIDICTIDNAVGSPCKNGEATYLVTLDGRHKFRVPCSFHLPFPVASTRTT